MRTILLIVLVLLLIGALPAWPYSTGWGYYPSGGLGLILLILIILAVMGRISSYFSPSSSSSQPSSFRAATDQHITAHSSRSG
jgi:Protein of unknown function (DUF3309)